MPCTVMSTRPKIETHRARTVIFEELTTKSPKLGTLERYATTVDWRSGPSLGTAVLVRDAYS